MIASSRTKVLELYNQHETKLDVLFFVGGFLFDILLASEIGDPISVAQQIAYLLMIATLLHFEVIFRAKKWEPVGLMLKLWEYRGLLLHFLLGGLLNMYSLFYIKSASLMNSIVFLAVLIGVILANELPAVKRSHVSFKVAMYAICLFSFVSMMFPFLFGFVGWIPFGLSVATTLYLFYLQHRLLRKMIPDDVFIFRNLMGPACGVVGVFAVFYLLGLVPPVPLSVSDQGIYHSIEKKEGRYYLSTEVSNWDFLGLGNFGTRTFRAAPGDKIYFYAQIFSPSRFADDVYVQWAWKDPKRGWQVQDRIPFKIVGGRREGFRGYTLKSNYQPGDWRVQVFSASEQEISRMYFSVVSELESSERVLTTVVR